MFLDIMFEFSFQEQEYWAVFNSEFFFCIIDFLGEILGKRINFEMLDNKQRTECFRSDCST